MTGMTDLVEQLLWHDESTTLDFKQAQYPLATDDEKGELIKDILAFANAFRREDAYILLGVQEVQAERATILGVSQHLKESDVQQLVNSKTNRTVTFSYHTLTIDGLQVGVIRIPRQERPSFLRKSYGKLHADAAYLRRGSSTSIATPDEIKRMALEDHPPANDAEISALERLHERARFGDTVWLSMETLSRHPEHHLTIAPSDAYDSFRREHQARLAAEHHAFQQDISGATDLLDAKYAIGNTADQAAIKQIMDAAREVRETVQTLVSASNEKFALDHTNARENARNAAENLSALVAARRVSLGAT